jgi:hypothetical protein
MQTMNQSLLDLFERKLITAEAAEAASPDGDELLRLAHIPAPQHAPGTGGIAG